MNVVCADLDMPIDLYPRTYEQKSRPRS